jgi:hypothetical protein
MGETLCRSASPGQIRMVPLRGRSGTLTSGATDETLSVRQAFEANGELTAGDILRSDTASTALAHGGTRA